MLLNPLSGSPIPADLYSLLPIVLVVGALAVLFAGRQDPDPRGLRPLARYLGAVSLLTLFIALYAALGAVGSLTDLMVDHTQRAQVSERAFNSDSGLAAAPVTSNVLPVLFPLYDFSFDHNNNSNYTYAVGSGLVALTTGGIFVLHARGRRRLEAGAPGDTVVDRASRAYRCGVCAASALTFAVAVTTIGYAVFEIAAPGISGGGFPASVIRDEGIAELLAFLVLAAASALLFRGSWRHIRPTFPTAATARSTGTAKRGSAPSKRATTPTAKRRSR